MRIPLDYYRILGLPIQASAEQLQQAYHDRILQLPRREYSEAAIAARKQLLEEAYAILSAPKRRTRYDANYFAYTHDDTQDSTEPTDEERHAKSFAESSEPILPSGVVLNAVDRHTPSIEISDELFVGALLILQELGEYELVLNLGCPFLSNNSVTPEGRQRSTPKFAQPDIILTVALACLELGREQWQQGQYEHAATSLESGQKLLLSEGLFVHVRSAIQADLSKLRPYRILELLATEYNAAVRRRLGLKLLQDMLQERGGIDGTGDDESGLSIDDFLQFIQQLRSYLTVAEQQSLFEAESQRPSAVATYLAVYALIARGFAQRQPALIRQAKLLLMRLSKRQDLYLEQSVCSLLLGQTAEASRALELSQEYEPLAFIQEHSQGSPDLLPGLCLYAERWLQSEVFPHFLDLAEQQASLKNYFADAQVQAYLEALPMQLEATDEWAIEAPQAFTYTQKPSNHQSSAPTLVSQSSSTNGHKQHVPDTTRGMPTNVRTHRLDDTTSSQTTMNATNATSSEVAIPRTAERIVRTTVNHNLTSSLNGSALVQVKSPQRSRRRTRSRLTIGFGAFKTSELRFLKQSSNLVLAFRNVLEAKKTRLFLLVLAGVLSIVVLGFLASQTYAWLKQTFSSTLR